MQQGINSVFSNIFEILTNFLSVFVHDPGTKWGLAIILFTVLFNLLVLPLNWKAMVNSKKMGEIQPELKKIQEKYKNDPQKLQAEQSKFMKENNVSMLGGCLPLLVTWPLFIAMYNVFRVLSVGDGPLVGLKFTPIIPDLSAYHNIPLTIVVVIATLGQQWMMNQANKYKSQEVKAQAQQMQVMNIMMTAMMAWITYTQPAALGLYWVAGTIFRIVQQYFMNKVDENEYLKKMENQVKVVEDTPISKSRRKKK